jgi:hypothetical protein
MARPWQVWLSDRRNLMVTHHREHRRWAHPGPLDTYRQGTAQVHEQWRRVGGAEWREIRARHANHPRLPALRRLLCRIYGPDAIAMAEGTCERIAS